MSTDTTAPAATASMPGVLDIHPVDAGVGITDSEQLRNHLLQAAALEMQTIPMYLYSLYSIGGQGTSRWDPGIGAQRLIRSVVIEEMLHLCLVRNILVALGYGDQVTFYDKNFMPDFPEYMLHRHPGLLLRMGPCAPELVKGVFMEFERPNPAPGEGTPPKGQYATIGRFYASVTAGLEKLDKQLGRKLWENSHPELQYVAAYWNKDGGGKPIPVKDLATAKKAMKMIVDQGEGADPDKPSVPIDPLNPKPGLDELPHYTKFKRIADGIEPIGPVWRVPTDPQSFQYEDDAAATAINNLFNAAYCYVLHLIDVLYRTPGTDVKPGETSTRYGLERTFVSAMQGLLANIAETMVARKIQQGPMADSEFQMAPTFEYVELPATGKKQHLIRLCDEAVTHFPKLGGDNGVRWLLDKMPDV